MRQCDAHARRSQGAYCCQTVALLPSAQRQQHHRVAKGQYQRQQAQPDPHGAPAGQEPRAEIGQLYEQKQRRESPNMRPGASVPAVIHFRAPPETFYATILSARRRPRKSAP